MGVSLAREGRGVRRVAGSPEETTPEVKIAAGIRLVPAGLPARVAAPREPEKPAAAPVVNPKAELQGARASVALRLVTAGAVARRPLATSSPIPVSNA